VYFSFLQTVVWSLKPSGLMAVALDTGAGFPRAQRNAGVPLG